MPACVCVCACVCQCARECQESSFCVYALNICMFLPQFLEEQIKKRDSMRERFHSFPLRKCYTLNLTEFSLLNHVFQWFKFTLLTNLSAIFKTIPTKSLTISN